ncbi:MAG: hypothetical protein JSR18_10905 [Proteobacteria bacterium]|nr:hypothetical protein [Pseudomonadota bacterium]
MRKILLLALLAVSGSACAATALLANERTQSLQGSLYTVCTYSNGNQSIVKFHEGMVACARSIALSNKPM